MISFLPVAAPGLARRAFALRCLLLMLRRLCARGVPTALLGRRCRLRTRGCFRTLTFLLILLTRLLAAIAFFIGRTFTLRFPFPALRRLCAWNVPATLLRRG